MPEAVLLYKTEKMAVGEKNSVRTTINVDIPESAGQIILEFGYEGGDYLVGEITFNYSGGARFNFLRAGIVLAVLAILVVAIKVFGCDAIATLIPLLFTRPIFMVEQFILKAKEDKHANSN